MLAPRLLQWRGTASTAPTWGQAAMTWCGDQPVCASATLLPALRFCPHWHMTGALASCCRLLASTECSARCQGTKDARVARATPILCLPFPESRKCGARSGAQRLAGTACTPSPCLNTAGCRGACVCAMPVQPAAWYLRRAGGPHLAGVFEHPGAPGGLHARRAAPAGGACGLPRGGCGAPGGCGAAAAATCARTAPP